MSTYYNAQRTRNLYDPNSSEPHKISRTKLELFVGCPCCFYADVRLGVGRPPGFPFALNKAVDTLLKQEFDIHRAKGEQHPLMKAYGIDAVPIPHEKLEQWRHNFTGVQVHHKPTNLIIYGAIDDLWQNSKGEYVVVDYKATSKNGKIIELTEDWQESYKRQMEIYQWLLRQNGYTVSDTGYFVYCNAQTDRESFDGRIEFETTLIPHKGNDDWVERIITDARACLMSDALPSSGEDCDSCAYREAFANAVRSSS